MGVSFAAGHALDLEPIGAPAAAPASWSATALCRFRCRHAIQKRQRAAAVQDLAALRPALQRAATIAGAYLPVTSSLRTESCESWRSDPHAPGVPCACRSPPTCLRATP